MEVVLLVPLTSLGLSQTNLPQKVHCPEMFIEIIEQVMLLLDRNSRVSQKLVKNNGPNSAYYTEYHLWQNSEDEYSDRIWLTTFFIFMHLCDQDEQLLAHHQLKKINLKSQLN